MPERELLTVYQAAERAAVSRRSIYIWMQQGKVEFCRTAGGNVRVFADSLFREGTLTRPTVTTLTVAEPSDDAGDPVDPTLGDA